MGIVDDGHQQFAGAMDAKGFLDQKPFATVVAALELNLKGLAEDAQGVVIGVQSAVDDRCNHSLGIVVEQRLFEHAFAGARFAEHQTEAALLSESSFLEFAALQGGRCAFLCIHPNVSTHGPPHPVLSREPRKLSLISESALMTELEARLRPALSCD